MMNGYRGATCLSLVVGLLGGAVACGGSPSELPNENESHALQSVADSNWSNLGGNAGRNGQSSVAGPSAATPRWSGGRFSQRAYHPVVEAGRVFVVREAIGPTGPGDALVVAIDVVTGAELWHAEIPYKSGETVPWIAGVRDGRVYASRSKGAFATQETSSLFALSAESGAVLWTSNEPIGAEATDGVIFAENGDPILGEFERVRRIRASDGTTAWTSPRMCSVGGSCGAAAIGNAIYVADWDIDGHVMKRFDAATGKLAYVSSLMADPRSNHGLRNTPMVGPDGAVYLTHTTNDERYDQVYAFKDTGSALVERWHVPTGWSKHADFAVGTDGSVYALGKNHEIVRLDASTGAVKNRSASISDGASLIPRMAVDSQGRLFVSNGGAEDGAVYSFDADLTLRWSVPVHDIAQGGPALGADGTLVVAGVDTDIRAYR